MDFARTRAERAARRGGEPPPAPDLPTAQHRDAEIVTAAPKRSLAWPGTNTPVPYSPASPTQPPQSLRSRLQGCPMNTKPASVR